jgi:GTP-binding protein HflX
MQEILLEETVNVILVGVNLGEREEYFYRSMKELKSLAEACGKKTVGIVTQNMESVNQGFYVGTGKVKEIMGLTESIEGRNVLIVEDIIDSGVTATQLRKELA